MEKALIVRNLSKRFFRNPSIKGSQSIRDLFRQILGVGKVDSLRDDEFYALRGLSFELNKGESLALVGRNGCGKTTALKIITGLLKPDYGEVVSYGNVQALIALGAGFNPNLSGRENILNSAALLGMKSKQIKKLTGDIIEFAELEEFIDGPVNTYSSGMYARLGFSVAVHMQPEILIIDEILGVGDYAFQNKCFIRMQELKNRGTTIVLVSHSQAKIVQMCDRAIWLDHGNVVLDGSSQIVVDKYIKSLETRTCLKNKKTVNREKNDVVNDLYGPIYQNTEYVKDVNLNLKNSNDELVNNFKVHDSFSIEYSFEILKEVKNLNVSINIVTLDGKLVTTISTLNGDLLKNRNFGTIRCKISISDLILNPGQYLITMPIHNGNAYLFRDIVAKFNIATRNSMTWGIVDFNFDYEILD